MSKPTLVLIPGLLNTHLLWQHVTAAVETDYDVWVPEIHHWPSVEEIARAVLAQAPDRFALGGLSMGGYVSLEIVRQAPQRVTRLALIDTSARPDTDAQRTRRAGLIDLAQRGKFKGITPRLMPLLLHPDHLEDEAITDPIYRMAEEIGQSGFVIQQRAIMSRIDSRPSLGAIRVPTQIVVGRQDQLTPVEVAVEMNRLIKGSELTIVDDCGHLAPLEQPAKTVKAVRGWLGL